VVAGSGITTLCTYPTGDINGQMERTVTWKALGADNRLPISNVVLVLVLCGIFEKIYRAAARLGGLLKGIHWVNQMRIC